MILSYKTIKNISEGLYKEKGSKFIGLGYPVKDENEIKSIIESLKKKYHDARHHCYAYQFGVEEKRYRINDDGEPSGSAGKPIYNQIISNNLTNILIVVIRYFGGKLLGVGGLINAYRNAAEDVIKNADIIEKNIQRELVIIFPYSETNTIMKIIKDHSISIIHEKYKINCEIKIGIRISDYDIILEKLHALNEIIITNEK